MIWDAMKQGPCNLLLLELSVSPASWSPIGSLRCFSAEVEWRVTCDVVGLGSRNDVASLLCRIYCAETLPISPHDRVVCCLLSVYSRHDDATRGQRCARCKVWAYGTTFSVGVCSAQGAASLRESVHFAIRKNRSLGSSENRCQNLVLNTV